MKKLFLLTVMLLAAVNVMAAKVAEVKFEQAGSMPLSEGLMLSNVALRAGMEFDRAALDADVRRLYATGNFADIAAVTEDQKDGRIAVTFKLRLKPRITKITFEGNQKFETVELRNEITLSEGGLLKDKEYAESARKLREFYRGKGYNEATITPIQIPESKETVAITFRIDEKLRQRIHDVTFEGADAFSQWDLRHSIASQYSYWNWLPFINDYLNRGLLDRRELELDQARLREKYHAAGFLDFKVEDMQVIQLKEEPEYFDIKFKLSEGKPYKVGKVTITGSKIYKLEELTPLVQLKSGDVFSSEKESASARAIAGLYEMIGHADIICSAKRNADFEKKIVDVEFQITEGRKYTVHDVIINGNTYTKDKVLRRELVIAPGDPVDRNRIEASRQRLLGMGYFSKVEAASVGADALDEKDVVFNVEEKEDKYYLRIGAGASDNNNVFGMAEISTNNFDITNPKDWFYGGGQRFRLQGIIGMENAGFNVDFVEPWLLDMPLRLEVSAFMNETYYENWDEDHVGARFSLSRRFFDDFTSVTAGYKIENVRVHNIDRKLKNYMRENGDSGSHVVSQPSILIARDTRNSLLNPTSGYNVSLFASVTPEFLGSSDSYYRLEAKGSFYYSFWDEAIVTMIGGKIGTVSGFHSNDDIPVFERYFMGGTGSLRGFEYRTVSPTYDDENIGGQSMILMTAEISHPIWGPLRGFAFVDVGTVGSNAYSIPLHNLNMGAGYGIRIKIPQLNAPLELALAYPIVNNQDSEKSRLRIHFNVGMGLAF